MTLKQICDVKNHQLIISLPDSFTDKKKVLVTIEDDFETHADKITLLKLASSDPLFLSDVKEVSDDFNSIEHETL